VASTGAAKVFEGAQISGLVHKLELFAAGEARWQLDDGVAEACCSEPT
jgi:hypothetical protein